MNITHVTAHNWRNFKTLDFPLDSRLFVVGPNAAGKSNLLDLFRFLGDIASPRGGLAAAMAARGGLSKVRSLFARSWKGGRLIIDVALTDEGAEWRYRLAIGGEPGGLNRPVIYEERVEKDGLVLLNRPNAEDNEDKELLTQTHLEQITANQKFRALAEYFAKVQYFNLVPQIIRDPGRFGMVKEDPFGADFIARINAEQPTRRNAWLRRMQAALSAAVPEFQSLQLEVDSAGRPHLIAGYKNWRDNPARQNEAEFSDGTLRLIGLLWTLVSAPTNSGVLLLEEPELSLNAAIVRTLPTVLARAQRDRAALQVMLSTHAPEILDDEGVRPSEILVLRVTGDGTVAHILADIDEVSDDIAAELPKSEIVDRLIAPNDLSGLIAAGRSKRR